MRACYICGKIDVLNSCVAAFSDFEIIKNFNYFAGIAIVELKDSPAVICKTCEKLCKVCVDFKKKCIEADHTRKIQSNERFLWVENLRDLRKYQPIEDEVITIETIEPLMEEPPVVREINDTTANDNIIIPENDSQALDFIDKLSHDQVKEMTDEVTKLFANDFFEIEQFQFIKNSNSTTTLSNAVVPSLPRVFNCKKCKAKFPDFRKLMIHKNAAHRRRKRF